MKAIMCLVVGLALSLLGGYAGAEVLEVAPSEAAVAASGGDGWTRVALKFDLSGMREGTGRRVVRAHLEWAITGVPSDEMSAYYAHEITETWTLSGVEASAANLSYGEVPAGKWEIAPLDYTRNGGFVRLDVTSLVEAWASEGKQNNGLALLTQDGSAGTLTSQLGNPRLVIGYSFYKY
jgi:hypothetical protein